MGADSLREMLTVLGFLLGTLVATLLVAVWAAHLGHRRWRKTALDPDGRREFDRRSL